MNTRRMNRLEELGRVDAEKAFTKKGARNLRDEKKRIVRELKADGGKVKLFGGKVKKKNKKKKPIREVDFGATLEAATEKNRNPMKDQRLDDSFKGKTVRFKKADGGKVLKKLPGKSKQQRKMGDKGIKKEGIKVKVRTKEGPAKQYNTDKVFTLKKDGGKVGGLKKVQPHQKGLKKLPTKVRNKMGYMRKGGRVGMGKALRGGGCVR